VATSGWLPKLTCLIAAVSAARSGADAARIKQLFEVLMRRVNRKTRSGPKRADDPSTEEQEMSWFSVESGPWRTVGVSVASPTHLTNGKGCEDQIKCVERNGVLACALADGAGARKKCKIGARIAVDEACEELVEHFDDVRNRPRAEALMHRIKFRLARRAAELQEDTCQFASTLAFVAIRGLEYVAGNLGDGIVGRVQDSGTNILLEPKWGEFANQTYFTTDLVAIEQLRIVPGRAGEDRSTFLLMSDGPVKRLYDFRSKALSPNGAKIGSWLFKSDADEVLRSLQSYMKNTLAPRANDDCSIILVGQVGSSDAATRPARNFLFLFSFLFLPRLGRCPNGGLSTKGRPKKRFIRHLSAPKDSDAASRERSGAAWRRMRAALTAMFDRTPKQR
jgi:hypothetical protein